MYILSIVTTTVLSLFNATFTIFAASGFMASGNTAARLPIIIMDYLYGLLIPTIFFFCVYYFSTRKDHLANKKLLLSFSFAMLQAIVSIILYNLNSQAINSNATTISQLIPSLIIEGIVTVSCFIIAIITAIQAAKERSSTKSTTKISFQSVSKLSSWTSLIVGLFSLLIGIVSISVVRATGGNQFFQTLITCIKYFQMLCPAIFATTIITTLTGEDKKYTIISWIGTIALFITYIGLYTIAYI